MSIIATIKLYTASTVLAISSCTFPGNVETKPSIPIVYVNEAYGQNMNKMIEKCRYESMMVVLGKWKASFGTLTDSEMIDLQKQLLTKCVRFYKLDI